MCTNPLKALWRKFDNMLTIHTIRFKNFMSYGNAWTEIDVSKSQTLGIFGKNGHGKTCILNAVVFALYGRSFSGITKSKLINTINAKNLLVEVKFSIDNITYRVIRGVRPSVFLIYKEEVLIEQQAHNRDYQEVLENQIIKMTYKTFIQTVIVSMSNYTPFMELSASERRIVVEDILGLSVLTTMNQIVKEDMEQNANELKTTQYELSTVKQLISNEYSVLETYHKNRKDNIEQLKKEQIRITNEIQSHQASISAMNDMLKNCDQVKTKYDELKQLINTIQNRQKELNIFLSSIEKLHTFLSSHDVCPTCRQKIDVLFKSQIEESNNAERSKFNSESNDLEQRLSTLLKKQDKFLTILDKINAINQKINATNYKISFLNNQLLNVSNKITSNDETKSIEELQTKIVNDLRYAKNLLEKKKKHIDNNVLYETAVRLLKDDGIKSAIVNQYLPIINQTINKYLNDMDFYLSFELDNQFNETIKIRGRDDMNYQNLSQGEKRRLDMAIMFAWRYIASIRNSCCCSNIFVDEVLDSSLDNEGMLAIMKLFKSMKESHILVISHRESIQEFNFDDVYFVSKPDQFSIMKSM